MRDQWRVLLTLMIKDWKLLWSDRRAALVSFCVPVILASGFGLLFDRPQAQGEEAVLPICLVIEDGGPCTAAVVQGFVSSSRLRVQVGDRAAAEAAVRRRRVAVAAVIPAGFEAAARQWSLLRLSGGSEVPRLLLLHGGNSGFEIQWAVGVITELVVKQLCWQQGGGAWAAEMERWSAPVQIVPLSVVSQPRAHFDVYTHSFCGMTLQYLLLWGMESGLLLLRERQGGAWCRLQAMAASWRSVLTAKALTTAAMAGLQVVVTFTFGWLVFGVRVQGSMLGFLLLTGAVCLLSAATGLTVAAWGGREARARNWSILVILGVSMLGGLWFPTFLLPEWVREVALTLPTSWAMEGWSAVTWQGACLLAVLPAIGMVGAFAVILLALAVIRMHHLERRS
jgi:ABC-2 type transport system permease protein